MQIGKEVYNLTCNVLGFRGCKLSYVYYFIHDINHTFKKKLSNMQVILWINKLEFT